MIEPELRCYGKRLPSSKSLGGRQKDFLFHPNVAEKPGAKWSIRSLIDLMGMSHSLLKQRFKSPVVFHKKVCDRPHFLVLS